MKTKPVDSMPRRGKHKLQDFISEFVRSDEKIVEVIFDSNDYKSPKVCYSCLHLAARNMNSGIKVHIRGDKVFMEK